MICKDFKNWYSKQGIKHFTAEEVLYLGASNSNKHSRAFGKNTIPRRELWENIVPTLKVLDSLREYLGKPIRLISIYRAPAYNKAIGGAIGSQHMKFTALDFVVADVTKPYEWADKLLVWREAGMFKGGIGIYKTFVHLDTRGKNTNW